MATDFIKIGGEIISSPLNRNFRNLRNDISIANVNLAFSNEDGIKNTIDDMLAIENPDNAQACYIISSGEFYRYSEGDKEWHKIMDIGQTFRQGFLNSGAVILENEITLKEGTTQVLVMPRMLVYFKNQPGDGRYLKGMYRFDTTEVDTSLMSLTTNAYSIKVDVYGNYTLHQGMPEMDDPNYIYVGSVIVKYDGSIEPNFIFTMPDIAYTADRGQFMFGSQAKGLNLTHSITEDNRVNRQGGYYYDEGINYVKGSTDAYPNITENGANYNLKSFPLVSNAPLYYMAPVGGLNGEGLQQQEGLDPTRIYENGSLTDLPTGYYTIQQHLVTPNGQNIMLYGSVKYNSMEDAYSHINDPVGAVINFPYVEATRVVLGNVSNFSAFDEENCCRFETLGRLSQVGTIKPEYADNVFKIYSGVPSDTEPAMIKFDLTNLYNENFNELYNLVIGPYSTTTHLFGLSKVYDYGTTTLDKTMTGTRNRSHFGKGYLLADNADIEDVRSRLNNIESEIWKIHDATYSEIYRQGIRYRLFSAETNIASNRADIDAHYAVLLTKADKSLKINGHTLEKDFDLTTTHIAEGSNEYYTTAKVQSVPEVVAAKEHYLTVGSDTERVNPHNLYADDLKDNGINYHVVSTAQVNKINNLYDNTKSVIEALDSKTIDYITIDKYDGDSSDSSHDITEVGNVKRLRFYDHGVSLVKNGDILEIDCKGHTDEETLMWKKNYATKSDRAVDMALNATSASKLDGVDSIAAGYYYGTNSAGTAGFHKLSVVTTEEKDENATIDNVVIEPTVGSVGYEHLKADLKNKVQNNYHTIYDGGQLASTEINEINFGDNFEVQVKDNKVTVNIASDIHDTAVREFADLADVDVVYTNNAGKNLVVNADGTGIVLSDALPLSAYMLIDTYGENGTGKVAYSKLSDRALNADSAVNAQKLNNKSVDDSTTNSSVLWTASKIQTVVTNAIDTCCKTFYGTGTPTASNTRGSKAGDIYIMVE